MKSLRCLNVLILKDGETKNPYIIRRKYILRITDKKGKDRTERLC